MIAIWPQSKLCITLTIILFGPSIHVAIQRYEHSRRDDRGYKGSISKVKQSSSFLPFLEYFLGYFKALMAADEQCLNLCVCPLWHRRGTNT